jgi:chloramphenicol-sensitive protein RarD
LDFPLSTLVSHRLSKISKSSAGVMFAASSYLWWALVTPLYFKVLAEIPVVELLIWRIISGLPILIGLLIYRKKLAACFKALKNRKTLLLLLGSTFFISINWVVFVLAVVWDRLTEASLGYYINPLVSVALGYLFLGERIRPLQIIAVGIALVGVVYLTIAQGALPWISVSLAGTFAMYGLFRKVMGVGSIEGLTVEMTFTFPICLVLQWWLISNNESVIGGGNSLFTIGLILGGFVTIVPLLLFASGARRLQLATMGILQYIAPTGQLLLATLMFNEPFQRTQYIVFGLIWTAILLYSFDALRSKKDAVADSS